MQANKELDYLPHVQFVDPEVLETLQSRSPRTVRIHLRGGTLRTRMPLSIKAALDAKNKTLTLEGNYPTRVRLAGGQLSLRSLFIKMHVNRRVSSQNKQGQTRPRSNKPIKLISDAVQVGGEVLWQSGTLEPLGLEKTRLVFDLAYGQTENDESGFLLNLRSITIKKLGIHLETGRLFVADRPQDATTEYIIEGEGHLTATEEENDLPLAQRLQDHWVEAIGLKPVSGLKGRQVGFQIRQTFGLGRKRLPARPQGKPVLHLKPSWSAQSPIELTRQSMDHRYHLIATLGDPWFTFDFSENGRNAFEVVNIAFENSRIRFPDYQKLNGHELSGAIDFRPDGRNWFFQPETLNESDRERPEAFPDYLERRIEGQYGLLALDELWNLISLRELEFDWYTIFQSLLPIDRAVFARSFQAVLMRPDAPPPEQLFPIAFSALSRKASALYPIIWQVWFEFFPAVARMGKLVELLQNVFTEINTAAYDILLSTLFTIAIPQPDFLAGFLRLFLEAGAVKIGDSLGAFLRIWVRVFAALLDNVADLDELAKTLLSIMTTDQNPPASLRKYVNWTSLSPLSGLGIITDPFFNTRIDVLLIGFALKALLTTNDFIGSFGSISNGLEIIQNLFVPVTSWLHTLFTEPPLLSEGILSQIIFALLTNAENDEAAELWILELGRIFPLGILFALVGSAWNLIAKPLPWWALMNHNVAKDPETSVTLPAPTERDDNGKPVKYLIFSDIHRDAKRDDIGPFRFGSINHFSENHRLYCDILDYAYEEGYTVIEAGDGEELWFIRDFGNFTSFEDVLGEITQHDVEYIDENGGRRTVNSYEKLAALHKENRFIRLYGNHDSYLRRPEVFAKLNERFEAEGAYGLKIYDYAVIPCVKTMQDFAFGSLVGEIFSGLSADEKASALLEEVGTGRLGFDSDPYSERKPMIVTHGHQFDFWNCDANNLVGKLFANSVGVPVDWVNDPLNDLGGIALQGAPLVDFTEILANLPVFNNFPADVPARKFAHQIQHMPEKRRMLIDDAFFLETITALIGQLAMPVILKEDVKCPDQDSIPKSLCPSWDHLNNQLCIGHTHYPQAQPYYDIEGLLAGPMKPFADVFRGLVESMLFGLPLSLNFIRARYYNSGTVGWMEGVVWAIEINEFSEARLVYWTNETKVDTPQTMDWQLPRMQDSLREAWESLQPELAQYFDQELPDLMGETIEATLANLEQATSIPIEALLAFIDDSGDGDEAVVDIADFTANTQLQGIQSVVMRVFLGLMRTLCPDVGTPSVPSKYTLVVPLPDEVKADLLKAREMIETWLGLISDPDLQDKLASRLDAIACLWALLIRNVPVIGGGFSEILGLTNSFRASYPALWQVMMLILMLPKVGDSDLLGIRARIEGDSLKLQINL
jgi:hypothetical protein